jgi:hypothetical protein
MADNASNEQPIHAALMLLRDVLNSRSFGKLRSTNNGTLLPNGRPRNAGAMRVEQEQVIIFANW